MASLTEENYLKSIHSLMEKSSSAPVTTNDLSAAMKIKAASVTDMLKKLSAKKLIHYKKYQGVLLTHTGKLLAISIIRKHRLWELFLTEKLKFSWDQVHEMAEELEHVSSQQLIERLDAFLGHPKFDPHGDPIPDHNGKMADYKFFNLSSLTINEKGKVATVIEQQPSFLKHLNKLNIKVGTTIKVLDRVDFDKSLTISVGSSSLFSISNEIAKNILVSK
ncbi:MAG: metal-dependent transcriptional regulator [Chitinophagales bacterium]|nr:metal-dependent transcriptional regulator [Chitinophagales bacterium]